MLADAEHPISFRFVPHREEGSPHVSVTVWAGHREGGRGNAGTLVLRVEEWVALQALLVSVLPALSEGQEHLTAMLFEGIPQDLRNVPGQLAHVHAAVVAVHEGRTRVIFTDAVEPFELGES